MRGPRGPEEVSAQLLDPERGQVTWTQPSTAAEVVEVERSAWDDGRFAWRPFELAATLPAGTTSLVDGPGLVPYTRYRYRVRSVGTFDGIRVESPVAMGEVGARTGLLPPSDLRVEVDAGTYSLTWANHSAISTAVRVERLDGLVHPADVLPPFQPLATLAADATSFRDEDAAPGVYTYRVTALAGEAPASSAPATAVFQPEGFDASIVELPGWPALRAADGGFWTGSSWDGEGEGPHVTAWEPSGAGWTEHALEPGDYLVPPGVRLDAQGHPHAVLLAHVPNGTTAFPSDIVHAWHDGVAWRREVIARRMLESWDTWMISFALDADGEPQVVWKTSRMSNWRAFPEHARRTEGGWVVEEVPSALIDPVRAYSFAPISFAPDGSLHLLVAQVGTLVLATRTAAGWTEEVVPTPAGFHSSSTELLLLERDGSLSVALSCGDGGGTRGGRIVLVEKTADGWRDTAELGASTWSLQDPWAGTASATRLAVVVSTLDPEGLWLHAWDPDGGWRSTRLRQVMDLGAATGIDAGGKIWVLAPARRVSAWDAAGAPLPWILYTER